MSDAADILLREVARKIQLPPFLHNLAVERYETIYGWLGRPESRLRTVLGDIYPQGSMKIGSSISSKFDTDEFDIDLLLDLALPDDADPRWVLDTLYETIRGPAGSRYHDCTTRQTRCVTVDYAEMHLDITPAIRFPAGYEPRTSYIFHSKQEEPRHLDRRITANPWGFGEWFIERTPLERELAEALVKARKMAEPVKDQEPVEDKSLALISLQLLKRWRNITYEARVKHGWRKPPSVLMAKLVADAATGRNRSLHAEMLRQIEHMHRVFNAAHNAGKLVQIKNPKCDADVFSDRWPENLSVQERFLGELRSLHASVAQLAEVPLLEKQEILMALFGEQTARTVLAEFAKRTATAAVSGRLQHLTESGRVALGASGIGGIAAASARPTAPHTFFGDDREEPQEG